jgi:hypothetical protein
MSVILDGLRARTLDGRGGLARPSRTQGRRHLSPAPRFAAAATSARSATPTSTSGAQARSSSSRSSTAPRPVLRRFASGSPSTSGIAPRVSPRAAPRTTTTLSPRGSSPRSKPPRRRSRRASSEPPTVTFDILYVFVVLSLERRRILHVNVTAHPYAEWTAQQIVEAFGADGAFTFLNRDRDGIFGAVFDQRVTNLGVRQLRIAARSPWQDGYAERLVGTFRRELTDDLIVISVSPPTRVGPTSTEATGIRGPAGGPEDGRRRRTARVSDAVARATPGWCYAAGSGSRRCWSRAVATISERQLFRRVREYTNSTTRTDRTCPLRATRPANARSGRWLHFRASPGSIIGTRVAPPDRP